MTKNNLKTILVLFVIVLIFTLAGCANISIKTDLGGFYKSADSGKAWLKEKAVLNTLEKQEFLENVEVNVFTIDPQDSRTFYIGTKEKGLFFSYDSGKNWHKVKRLPKGEITAITVNPVKKHVVYVGVGKTLYKTADALRTWDPVYVDDKKSNDKIVEVFVDSLYPNRVYAGFSDGRVIKSKNEGTSWSLLKDFYGSIVKIYTPVTSNKIFIATSREDLLYSDKDQKEWNEVESLEKKLDKKIKEVYFKEDKFILVLTKESILKSQDGGETWTKLDLLLPSGHRDKSEIRVAGFSNSNTDILYYATGNTLYKSRNGGEDWITRDLDVDGLPVNIFVHPKDPDILYLATTK